MNELDKQHVLQVLDRIEAYQDDKTKRDFKALGIDFDDHQDLPDRYNQRKAGV